jgi:hypothetical protein
MNARRSGELFRCVVAAWLSVLAGCAPGLSGNLAPNQLPVVELTQFPASVTHRFFYSYRLEWTGSDPDGFVDHFMYAVDPPMAPGGDTSWVVTDERGVTLTLRSDEPDPSGASGAAIGFHTFVLKAVDNRGTASAVVQRAFFTSTVAPSVQIVTPQPAGLVSVSLAPSVRIVWQGTDPDGVGTDEPVKYKYILLTPSSVFPPSVAINDPDSLRRFFAPDFAGWDSTDAERKEASYSNLTPGATYVFAVVAFDEAGAWSPIFSLDNNVLRFRVGFSASLGPRLTLFSEFFSFTYPSGGYTLDPRAEIPIEVLPGDQVRLSWFATPSPGTSVQSYRWRLGGDVFDETPRENEQTDVSRWSTPSLLSQTTVVGPFSGGEEHRFYVEATDNVGLRSLGIVRITVPGGVGAFSKDLLIIKDTRFNADQAAPGGCVRPPIGTWPTAAELDTFLFARGGAPWKCYPQGTVSTPGLFAGYTFDTLGTGPGPISFSILGQYRHIVWLIDSRAALQTGAGGGSQAMTSLRFMSRTGQMNLLSAYLKRGGRVWLAGGGAGYASTIGYAGVTAPVFSAAAGELVPGRLMYDGTHWRSEFTVGSGQLLAILKSGRAVSDWPGAPDYSALPVRLDAKTPSTDPFPPNRQGQSANVFYKSVLEFEYLSRPNAIVEAAGPDTAAVLDTLYNVLSTSFPGNENTVMTLYHGAENGPVMFSGFDLWSYRRSQSGALVDFVLQHVWGLPKD